MMGRRAADSNSWQAGQFVLRLGVDYPVSIRIPLPLMMAITAMSDRMIIRAATGAINNQTGSPWPKGW